MKLTTHAWACLRDYESDSSDRNLAALRDIVSRRNQFVEKMCERRESGNEDFPDVFEGTLQELLHGDTKGSEKLTKTISSQ